MGIRQELLVASGSEDRGASEADLVRAAQAGDRAAVEDLVARYKRALFPICYGILGHVQDAEDAVQETFLHALQSLSGFRGQASFRTWLFHVAVNVCLDWKRARRPIDTWEEEPPGIPPGAHSPEVAALDRLRVLEALRSLPPRHRALLLLKEREGWSVAEIAAAMRCSPIRVKNELAKARRTLLAWRRQDAVEGEEA